MFTDTVVQVQLELATNNYIQSSVYGKQAFSVSKVHVMGLSSDRSDQEFVSRGESIAGCQIRATQT